MTVDNAALRPIMIIEDDPGLARLFQLVIGRARIANSIVAIGRGQDAIAYLLEPSSQLPAVVLLDLGLPDVDGIDLLALIRDRHDRATIPVVVLSGSGTASDVDRAMDAGANLFLAKPVGIGALIAALESLGLHEAHEEES